MPETVFLEIQQQLNRVEAYSLLAAKTVLTSAEAAMYIGVSKSHLYHLTSKKEIPHYKPNGGVVYFDKDELTEWMKQNRVETVLEAERRAESYIARRG